MPTIAFLLLATLRDTLRSRVALQLEVLALRQQLSSLALTFGVILSTAAAQELPSQKMLPVDGREYRATAHGNPYWKWSMT